MLLLLPAEPGRVIGDLLRAGGILGEPRLHPGPQRVLALEPQCEREVAEPKSCSAISARSVRRRWSSAGP